MAADSRSKCGHCCRKQRLISSFAVPSSAPETPATWRVWVKTQSSTPISSSGTTVAPGWLLFRDGCPGGETPERVGERMDRVIGRCRAVSGDVALFAHGHVLRVLAARWIGLPSRGGQHFLLDTETLCILSYYRGIPAIRTWNGPVIDKSAMAAEGGPGSLRRG
jgi:broad specificity phosphatase PhoE